MLKLMYITNAPQIAKIAELSGVDRIFVDLETIGKKERQSGMNTVQSNHSLDDIIRIKNILTKSDLLVRSNPIHKNSNKEIDSIINNGADIVMLPYFKSVNEAAKFIDLVQGRAKVCLLVETAEAVRKLDAILELDGIDEIHIGLNDLHLSYGMKFMFQLLADGTIDKIANKIRSKNIPFGFGGIAKLKEGLIPAEIIIKEHYRLGSSMVILSRSFCNIELCKNLNFIEDTFYKGVKDIRALETEIYKYYNYFESNKIELCNRVEKYLKSI